MERRRTPEERFRAIADFPYPAHYAEVDDPTGGPPLRVAYRDEGPREATVVVLLHGEPSWSYLYRVIIRDLVAAGRRVVAPDLIGFGQSDKPTDRRAYTYARHVEWMRQLLFDRLDLNDVTVFGQDWGSLIGLRLVAEQPDRVARVAVGNGGLPTGDERVSEAFTAWRAFSQSAPTLPIGHIVAGGCLRTLAPQEVDAYDAPFPDESYKEGARQFPLLVPVSVDDPAHDANVRAWSVLSAWTKPFLCCFSDGDAITRGADRRFVELVPGAADQPHTTIEGAGHFLQEDRGSELASVLVAFTASEGQK